VTQARARINRALSKHYYGGPNGWPHCKKGHPLSFKNRIIRKNGILVCKTCWENAANARRGKPRIIRPSDEHWTLSEADAYLDRCVRIETMPAWMQQQAKDELRVTHKMP
jgi:hypothetical protein